jgi:hypothetical protein
MDKKKGMGLRLDSNLWVMEATFVTENAFAIIQTFKTITSYKKGKH